MTDTVPGWDDPALPTDDADSPTEQQIRSWAEQYVTPQSAAAFAAHLWTEWDEYEPDGTLTVGQIITDVMRQWRGEGGGYPATPEPKETR